MNEYTIMGDRSRVDNERKKSFYHGIGKFIVILIKNDLFYYLRERVGDF